MKYSNASQSEFLPSSKSNRKAKLKQQPIVHLAYLFASPIVYSVDDKTYDTIAPISFKEEIDEIYEGLKSTKYNFRYMYKMATEAHLVECLSARPLGLHFSGHGCQNKVESY